MPICGEQCIVVVPVHFELAVGIFVIILIRAPAQLDHTVADLTDHIVAAHQGRLVVTRLTLGVVRIRYGHPVCTHQEVLTLYSCLHAIAFFGCPLELAFQCDPR